MPYPFPALLQTLQGETMKDSWLTKILEALTFMLIGAIITTLAMGLYAQHYHGVKLWELIP